MKRQQILARPKSATCLSQLQRTRSLKNDAQRLYLLSDSTMALVAQDVAKVALWLDEVFIVKSGRTRVEVHSGAQGPTEYEFTLDEPSEQFAVGAGGICSLSGASITCYDHGSGKRIFTLSPRRRLPIGNTCERPLAFALSISLRPILLGRR
tara:strand:+ start:292 stop:747 length:456 start_codon:yes stop_codon:yes gene_type:complete